MLYIPPKGDFYRFENEEQYAELTRLWGLSTARTVKKEFWYKEKAEKYSVTIEGYETYGKLDEFYTLVVRFEDGNLSCIHPDYFKDMQTNSFGKETETEVTLPKTKPATKSEAKTEIKKESKKEPKAKKIQIQLPDEKVHFTAKVKQFAHSWNHFNEENEEVVVLEDVIVTGDEPVEIGIAWCSHSKTLKKLELSAGELIEFDGKIVKKTLPKGKDVEEEFMLDVPAPFKINNPSKLTKK